MPTYKFFTKRYLAVPALVGLLGFGGVFAVTRGDDTYEECMAKPTTTYYDCQDLKHESSSTEESDTEGYYDRSELESDGYSDTEGYQQPTYVRPQPTYQPPQPKTCLEWRTNYRYQPGAPSQFGQPINPGSQVPTGQTCVRYG